MEIEAAVSYQPSAVSKQVLKRAYKSYYVTLNFTVGIPWEVSSSVANPSLEAVNTFPAIDPEINSG